MATTRQAIAPALLSQANENDRTVADQLRRAQEKDVNTEAEAMGNSNPDVEEEMHILTIRADGTLQLRGILVDHLRLAKARFPQTMSHTAACISIRHQFRDLVVRSATRPEYERVKVGIVASYYGSSKRCEALGKRFLALCREEARHQMLDQGD